MTKDQFVDRYIDDLWEIADLSAKWAALEETEKWTEAARAKHALEQKRDEMDALILDAPPGYLEDPRILEMGAKLEGMAHRNELLEFLPSWRREQ